MPKVDHARRFQGWLLAVPLVALSVLALSACGDDSSAPSQAELNAARKEGQQQARQQQQIKDLQEQLKQQDKTSDGSQTSTSSSGSTSGSFSGGTDCGNGVVAGPNTTCAFALNVASEFRSSGGSTQITVFSPVTGQTYSMTCTPGQPNVCRGGNNASVEFP